MIQAAVITNNTVTNIIYIDQANFELFISLGMELVDSAPLGLTIGDYRVGESWYRLVDGEETKLPIEHGNPVQPDETEQLKAIIDTLTGEVN